MKSTLSPDETMGFGLALPVGWLLLKKKKRDFLIRQNFTSEPSFLATISSQMLDPWSHCLLVSVHFLVLVSLHCLIPVLTSLTHPGAHTTAETLGFFPATSLWFMSEARNLDFPWVFLLVTSPLILSTKAWVSAVLGLMPVTESLTVNAPLKSSEFNRGNSKQPWSQCHMTGAVLC